MTDLRPMIGDEPDTILDINKKLSKLFNEYEPLIKGEPYLTNPNFNPGDHYVSEDSGCEYGTNICYYAEPKFNEYIGQYTFNGSSYITACTTQELLDKRYQEALTEMRMSRKFRDMPFADHVAIHKQMFVGIYRPRRYRWSNREVWTVTDYVDQTYIHTCLSEEKFTSNHAATLLAEMLSVYIQMLKMRCVPLYFYYAGITVDHNAIKQGKHPKWQLSNLECIEDRDQTLEEGLLNISHLDLLVRLVALLCGENTTNSYPFWNGASNILVDKYRSYGEFNADLFRNTTIPMGEYLDLFVTLYAYVKNGGKYEVPRLSLPSGEDMQIENPAELDIIWPTVNDGPNRVLEINQLLHRKYSRNHIFTNPVWLLDPAGVTWPYFLTCDKISRECYEKCPTGDDNTKYMVEPMITIFEDKQKCLYHDFKFGLEEMDRSYQFETSTIAKYTTIATHMFVSRCPPSKYRDVSYSVNVVVEAPQLDTFETCVKLIKEANLSRPYEFQYIRAIVEELIYVYGELLKMRFLPDFHRNGILIDFNAISRREIPRWKYLRYSGMNPKQTDGGDYNYAMSKLMEIVWRLGKALEGDSSNGVYISDDPGNPMWHGIYRLYLAHYDTMKQYLFSIPPDVDGFKIHCDYVFKMYELVKSYAK